MEDTCPRPPFVLYMHATGEEVYHSPEFTRLHHLKQLGVTHLTFPPATHSRAAHSLGVAQIARSLAASLGAVGVDLACIELAALCKDIGHGPLGDAFDQYMHERGAHQWTHQKQSERMMRQLFTRMIGTTAWRTTGMDPEPDVDKNKDVQFVLGLAKGTLAGGRGPEKAWMREVVYNKKSGVDADKIDGVSRDSLCVGLRPAYSQARILGGATVADDGSRILYSPEAYSEILKMLRRRREVCDRVFTHPSVVSATFAAMDIMHATLYEEGDDAFLALDDRAYGRIDQPPPAQTVQHDVPHDNVDHVRFCIGCGIPSSTIARSMWDMGILPRDTYKTFARHPNNAKIQIHRPILPMSVPSFVGSKEKCCTVTECIENHEDDGKSQ